MISHRAMIARATVQMLDRPTAPEDAFIAWTPMFHMGSTDAVFANLLRGDKVIVMDGFDAGILVDLIGREKLGHLTVVPGVVAEVISELKRTGVKPKGVKAVGRRESRKFYTYRYQDMPDIGCVRDHKAHLSEAPVEECCGSPRPLTAFIYRDWWSVQSR